MERILRKFRANNFGFIEIISRLINWGCLPLIALLIEPEIFGQIVLVYSYILVLTMLGAFGQQRAILMYGHSDDTVLYYTSILSFAATVIITCIAITLFNQSILILPIVILLVVINNLATHSRAKDDFFNFSLYRLGLTVTRFILVIVFLLIDASLMSYLLAELTCVTLVLISSFILKANVFKMPEQAKNSRKFFTFILFGLPLFLHAAVAQVTQIGDRFIVSSKLGDAALASYFFVAVFCSSVAFIFAFNAQKYEVKIYRATSLVLAKSNTLAFCMQSLKYAFFFYFFSISVYFILSGMVGKYKFDALFMTALYINFSMIVFSTSLNYYLSYLKKTKYVFILSACSAVIFVLSVVFLIEYIGLYSIPVSGSIVNLIFLVLFYIAVYQKRGIFDGGVDIVTK